MSNLHYNSSQITEQFVQKGFEIQSESIRLSKPADNGQVGSTLAAKEPVCVFLGGSRSNFL